MAKPQYVPSKEELQGAITDVLVEFDGPSPSAKNVRKVIENNNPSWKVPPSRRVSKLVKKHEQSVKSSSSTVSEEETLADDDLNPDNLTSPPNGQNRRSLLAFGASLSVRKLLSGNKGDHQPRRELKSKLSFRKKKLAGRRPSLTHMPANNHHDHHHDAAVSPTSVAESVPTTPTQEVEAEKTSPTKLVEESPAPSNAAKVGEDHDHHHDAAVSPAAVAESAPTTPTVVVDKPPTQEVEAEKTTPTKLVEESSAPSTAAEVGEEVPADSLVYQDENDGKVRKEELCAGCVIM